LLPENVHEIVNGKLSVLVTPLPLFGKTKISNFQSKQDLISANLASVHLPFFLDGNLAYPFRNQPHIDGSFFAKVEDYSIGNLCKSTVLLDWEKDPIMSQMGITDFVKAFSKDSIWKLLEQGRTFSSVMEERGDFRSLRKR